MSASVDDWTNSTPVLIVNADWLPPATVSCTITPTALLILASYTSAVNIQHDFMAQYICSSHNRSYIILVTVLVFLLYYLQPASKKLGHTKETPRVSKAMPITIRPLRHGDLDAIVEIVIKAFPFDEQFAYRYPYRAEYPEDHYKYTRIYYSEYLETTLAGQNTIMLAETTDATDPTKQKVIALSIWDNPGNKPPSDDLPAVPPPKNYLERKDCNPKRLEAYTAASMKARKEVFVDRFGQRQLSLRQMATHPDYWRHGAATKLLTWGMKRAREEGVAVPMFAGNMGRELYAKHGFKVLAKVHVQVEGEDEDLYILAMAWDPVGELTGPTELLEGTS